MRRTHLRGHDNILKRLLIHGGGFNVGLAMRQHLGIGTPRRLQGRRASWPSSSPEGRASVFCGGTMSQDSLIECRGRRLVIRRV